MRTVVCVCWLVLGVAGLAGEPADELTRAPAAAEACVAAALADNLALARAGLDVEQARARLAEVRSGYLPRVDLVARYSIADGGRTIDFPAGDLLNGVYHTLNQYLTSVGQPGAFPTLTNQSIPLLRDHEQETKLRVVQPLYRPEIARGAEARWAEQRSREASLAAYRRELRETVLRACYRLSQARSGVKILGAAAAVTAEAVRVNQVLLTNGQLTEDRLLRAQAEALAVEQQLAAARRDAAAAQYGLNFLLNRPLDTPVEEAAAAEVEAIALDLVALAPTETLSPAGREELAALDAAVAAAQAAEGVQAARNLPTVGLAVEGGIQGESYRTGAGANFVQGSVVAEFNLWDGHERRSQRDQARLARRAVELQRDEVRLQLALALRRARDDFGAAQLGFKAADGRLRAAARAFELVQAREREGMVNQLGFLDARREATAAALEREIALQTLLSSAAALDRAATLSPIFES